MTLYYIPKQAYFNALNATKAIAVYAEDFEIEVLLEWIKLFEIEIEKFDIGETNFITFNATDYYITISFNLVDSDCINILDIDCTDNRINHSVIKEYFKLNNNKLQII